MSSPSSFSLRLILVFVVVIAVVLIGRMLILPDSWGQYGYYRGTAVNEEASRAMTYGTNDSCMACHEEVYTIKKHDAHKRLSCEICHAPVTEHVKENKWYAAMPVKRGDMQRGLCLKCHQKVEGRPEKFPMIDAAQHLREQKAKPTHSCSLCHTVHAPLETMKHIEMIKKLRKQRKEAANEK